MTHKDRELLHEALGVSHAALSHARMLLVMLVRSDVIQASRALEYLDSAIFAAEKGVGEIGATPDLVARLRELSLTADMLSSISADTKKRE